MPDLCAQCGAALPSGETCEYRFYALNIKEQEDPTYYAVHHLQVLCYMLQHNGYSREGWIASRTLLDQFVHQGFTVAQVRQQGRSKFDSGQRTWSVTRGPKLAQVAEIEWTRTIADVRLDTAETYCADVQQWAVSVLKDTEPLMQTLSATP